MKTPHLGEIKKWDLDQVRAQRELELKEHRALLDRPDVHLEFYGGPKYKAATSRSYRLRYMEWLLEGSPLPKPNFV